MLRTVAATAIALGAVASAPAAGRAQTGCVIDHQGIPADIRAIFDKPFYQGATWGLRVDDLDSGTTLLDLQPDCPLFIGSVRKVFSVGELLNQIGPTYRYDTPVFRLGEIGAGGVLHGDLVLVASGDLTMGGRTNPDGTIAVTNFDHNEADSLGNAVLSAPDPLAGYRALAHEVARQGITAVTGDVIIDDRLFQPFHFRDQFYVRPIFVNDDVVDASIDPGDVGAPARVAIRPLSAALRIDNRLLTGAAGSDNTLKLNPELPQCIGRPGCSAAIEGDLPIDFKPFFTGKFPLVQTFRIVEPSNYARTVFIEALAAEGVAVSAAPVAPNRTAALPDRRSYRNDHQVAELAGLPCSDNMKLILKVSYNIGADTSLVLFGLTQGVDSMDAALDVERRVLPSIYGVPDDQFHFVDGSGGGDTVATSRAIITMLSELSAGVRHSRPSSARCRSSASTVRWPMSPTSNPTRRSPARPVRCAPRPAPTRPGKLRRGDRAQGPGLRRLHHDKRRTSTSSMKSSSTTFRSPVLSQVLQVFQDEGTASAILWRDF